MTALSPVPLTPPPTSAAAAAPSSDAAGADFAALLDAEASVAPAATGSTPVPPLPPSAPVLPAFPADAAPAPAPSVLLPTAVAPIEPPSDEARVNLAEEARKRAEELATLAANLATPAATSLPPTFSTENLEPATAAINAGPAAPLPTGPAALSQTSLAEAPPLADAPEPADPEFDEFVRKAAESLQRAEPSQSADKPAAPPAQPAPTGLPTTVPVSGAGKAGGPTGPEQRPALDSSPFGDVDAAPEAQETRPASKKASRGSDAPQINLVRPAPTPSAHGSAPKPTPQEAAAAAPDLPQLGAANAPNAGPAAAQAADLPPPGAAPPRPAPNLPDIARGIVQRTSNGARHFELQLHPAELGRIEVRIEIAKDNSVSASLSADDPRTLVDLARNARELERSLQQAGLQLSQNGLNFDLSRRDPGQQNNPGKFKGRSTEVFALELEPLDNGAGFSRPPPSRFGNARINLFA